MDKEFELFSTWWNEPQQDELRKSCASGWGWKIWQASRQQRPVTEVSGWRLVPIEPTQEMVDACFEGTCTGGIQKGYRAMLAAAPEVMP